MSIERSQVTPESQWDLQTLFPSFEDWEKEFKNIYSNQRHWPEVQQYRGQLGNGVEVLKKALESVLNISRSLSKLYTYAHLKHDEEITIDRNKSAYNRILSAYHEFNQATAWFEPELLGLDDRTIQSYLQSPLLNEYKFYLEKIVRNKPHTLSPEMEELLALGGKALSTPRKAFSAINDADFKFGTIKDSDGKERELTHALFGLYLRDHDRVLRENAFKRLHGQFLDYENTMCELLNGQIQAHIFNAKARKFPSCLEAALFPHNINIEVYHSLIQAVNENLHHLHNYIDLRKEILQVDSLHLYDMYVPLTSAVDIRMNYDEAEDVVIESAGVLGAEYQNKLRKGLREQKWVDKYENKNKRSGAYSSGCYDSNPYILMNYKGILRDVFTLAHEAGHSMHSLLSHENQPYHYGDYSIFVAEVASTFNEEILMRLLLERAKTREERIFLINEKIEDIRATLFRQAMFAEFELWLHNQAENNIPLTPQLLKEQYTKINKKYFGDSVVLDREAELEWARIPHFYYNFYVYQYATGISAALALAEKVRMGGGSDREAYLSFLKAGSSRYPIEILARAGVDMKSPAPVISALKTFGDLVEMMRKELIIKEIKSAHETIST